MTLLEGHDAAWHERRTQHLRASDFYKLFHGRRDDVYRLWEIKTGRRQADDADVDSDDCRIWMGKYLEPLIREKYSIRTGQAVFNINHEFVGDGSLDWMAAEVDGMTHTPDGQLAPIECKFSLNGGLDYLLRAYEPQMHAQMLVTKTTACVLAYISGSQWAWHLVEFDDMLGHEVLERGRWFWRCVQENTPPHGFVPGQGMKRGESAPLIRAEDAAFGNHFASLAADWKASKDLHDEHKRVSNELRDIVPSDAGGVIGFGLRVQRGKDGKVRIKSV